MCSRTGYAHPTTTNSPVNIDQPSTKRALMTFSCPSRGDRLKGASEMAALRGDSAWCQALSLLSAETAAMHSFFSFCSIRFKSSNLEEGSENRRDKRGEVGNSHED